MHRQVHEVSNFRINLLPSAFVSFKPNNRIWWCFSKWRLKKLVYGTMKIDLMTKGWTVYREASSFHYNRILQFCYKVNKCQKKTCVWVILAGQVSLGCLKLEPRIASWEWYLSFASFCFTIKIYDSLVSQQCDNLILNSETSAKLLLDLVRTHWQKRFRKKRKEKKPSHSLWFYHNPFIASHFLRAGVLHRQAKTSTQLH